jgi:hypothetical protein
MCTPHVVVTIDASLSNERIFAFVDSYNWNDILVIIHGSRPGQNFPDDLRDLPRDLSTVDNDIGEDSGRKWWNQDGYTSLKESVKQNLVGY